MVKKTATTKKTAATKKVPTKQTGTKKVSKQTKVATEKQSGFSLPRIRGNVVSGAGANPSTGKTFVFSTEAAIEIRRLVNGLANVITLEENKATLTPEMIRTSIANSRYASLLSSTATVDKEVTEARVVRMIKENISSDKVQISKDAKEELKRLFTLYIAELGQASGQVLRYAKKAKITSDLVKLVDNMIFNATI